MRKDEGRKKKGEIRGAKEAELIAEVNEGPKARGNPQLHSRHVGGGVIRVHPCLKAQWRECAIVNHHDDQQKQLVEKEKEEEEEEEEEDHESTSRGGAQER